MFTYGRSFYTEQFSHIFLSKPNCIIFKFSIKRYFTIIACVYYYFTF